MRKRSAIAVLVLALSILATIAAWPVAANTDDWAAEIAVGEETVYPNTDVTVEVTYTYQGAAPVPDDADCKFRLEIRGLSTAEGEETTVVRQSTEIAVPEAPGTGAGETFTVSAQISAPAEGNYTLVAILTVNGKASEHLRPLAVQSALPPGLARLFAGLAMFAAIMAIMAVGTEVLIDSVKVFVGMKEKVTALEALDLLKKELPGQLTNLGVSLQSQGKIDQLFADLEGVRTQLAKTLKPLETAGEVYKAIQGGQFSSAFAQVKTLEDELRQLQGQANAETDNDKKKALEEEVEVKLEAMKHTAQTGVTQVLTTLKATFKLDSNTVDQIGKRLQELIDTITLDALLRVADYTTDWVGGIFQEIEKNGAEWTANWLQAQARTYVETSGSQVMLLVDDNIVPLLSDLGFSPDKVQAVKSEIAARVDRLELVLDERANTYTQAVRNLLQAVEERRNDMQSPLRKIWRRLRDTDQVSALGVLAGIGFVIAILIVAALLPWPAPWPLNLIRIGIAVVCLLAFSACIWCGRWKVPTFGQGVQAIELRVNAILGREENPHRLGKVDLKVQSELIVMQPENVAAVLLKREDKHQDEEASRLRLLRVISVLVGGTLAYVLQIDALKLLDEALPGAAQVNLRLLPAGKVLWFTVQHELRAGIILTGLAAAAGSKFWRDLLGRLEATKEQAESAAILVRRAKSALGLEEEK